MAAYTYYDTSDDPVWDDEGLTLGQRVGLFRVYAGDTVFAPSSDMIAAGFTPAYTDESQILADLAVIGGYANWQPAQAAVVAEDELAG
jgi:hypothetical protein